MSRADRNVVDFRAQVDGRSDAELVAAVVAGDLAAHRALFDRHALPAWELALVCQQRVGAAETALRLAIGTAIVATQDERRFADIPFGLVLRRQVLAVAARVVQVTAMAGPRNGDDPVTAPNRLVEVFQALPEPERVALWLTEIQRLPLQTVAAALDLEPGAADAVLQRARDDLRRRILRVPRLERPPAPAAALAELAVPLPDGIGSRAAEDWRRWLGARPATEVRTATRHR